MKAQQFNMISRTVGERLPDCVFSTKEDEIGYTTIVEFHGSLEVVSKIPSYVDIWVDDRYLIGGAVQQEIRKNGGDYIALYHAYALHDFNQSFAS